MHAAGRADNTLLPAALPRHFLCSLPQSYTTWVLRETAERCARGPRLQLLPPLPPPLPPPAALSHPCSLTQPGTPPPFPAPEYFSQFGKVTKVRLSRSKKSGKSKHYAFLEFASPEVAAIASEAMDGYMLFTQKLVSRVLPAEEVHPDLFKGANRVFKQVGAGCWALGAGCWVLGAGCWVQGAAPWQPGGGCWEPT